MTTYSGTTLSGIYNHIVDGEYSCAPLYIHASDIDIGDGTAGGIEETGTFASVLTLPGGITVKTHI